VGAAIRLAKAPYKKVNTTQDVNKCDLMVAVHANDTLKESQIRSIMQEHGAIRFEEFQENWDPQIWSVLEEEASQVH